MGNKNQVIDFYPGPVFDFEILFQAIVLQKTMHNLNVRRKLFMP